MGCFFSIFKFGTYVVKETDPQPNAGSQVAVPEIRKHSSTPVVEAIPKQLQKTSAKPLLAKPPDKAAGAKEERRKEAEKEKTLYTTTFETQVDAAPPHPLEYQDIQLDEIEIDTNIFTPEAEDAVVKIQAGVRGYLTRKHINEKKNGLGNDQEEIPVVPPPKNFENQSLNPFNDLDKWKRLSDHLEDKVSDAIERGIEESIQPNINGPLTEAVIPLNDSNDNKVIETYVCKDNILDIEPTEEKPVFSKIKTVDERVVDRVFDVLMSETESESIINFVETNKSKIESIVEPLIKEVVDSHVCNKTDDNSAQESEVLANLNAILDNNESTSEEVSECDVKSKEEDNKISAEDQTIAQTLQSKVVEMVSNNTTQEIIRNSFHEFVKEMTETPKITEPVLKIDKIAMKSEETPLEIQPKVEERPKTDSMIFEEEVVQTIFDEELSKNQSKNQIFAIEVFKTDVKEEQLANVTTLCEPEPTVRNMWGVEEKVCKASIEKFVVKPVEIPPPIEPSIEDMPPVLTLDTFPVLETEQKIEIISSQSRKNSEDLLETDAIEETLLQTEEEVFPIPSPTIQVEEQNGNILDEEEAAIRIQAAFRGYQIRRSMSREASPNRGSNHNNIDSNNNNPGDNEDELIETAVQWIESNLQTNNELSVDYSPSEQPLILTTDEVSGSNATEVISTSVEPIVEPIDTSLQKLEDQLMQELISSAEEEDRTQALINDNLETQRATDEECSGLTAPLLLQRIQQSLSSNTSNADPEEQVPEVLDTSPETVPIDAQTVDEQIRAEAEDTPLIQKSDTIILDLMSSPQTINNQIIESDVKPIVSENDSILDQLSDSEGEVLDDTPVIISEVLKLDLKTEVITEEKTIDMSYQSIDPRPEPEESKVDSNKAQNVEPIEETKTQTPEPKILESQPQVTQIEEPVVIEVPTDSQTQQPQPIETPKPEPKAPEPTPEFNRVVEAVVIEPPTPDLENAQQITPELSYIQSPQEPVLTEVYSTESEQEAEVMSSDKLVESRPSMIPVLESNNKSKTGEQTDTIFKRPKPILKEEKSKVYTNIIPDEQTHSTSEEISSPDDDNPEFVGLGPNSPIPLRASSPNPFGKKRRRGKKAGAGPRK